MNTTQFFAHFDLISEAPGAVPRLRQFILNMAVRGKLVRQEDNDEPASELLRAVSNEWDRLLKSGIAKIGKAVSGVASEDGPFTLPSRWAFVLLGDVLQMSNGRAFKPTEWRAEGIPIVRIQNLNNPEAAFNYCDPQIVDERHRIDNGEFLISWSGTPGTSFGAFIWKRGPAALNQHIFRCQQVGAPFEPNFLRLAINTQLDVLISQAHGGAGLKHVTKGTLEKLVLAIPPLAEQYRIVAKINDLMALCDRLEAAQFERERYRDRLVATSLQRLNQTAIAAVHTKQHTQVHFYLQHLLQLSTRTEHIKALRQTIFDLAVRGALSKNKDWTLRRQPLRTAATLQNGYAFKSEWFSKTGIRLLRNTNVSHDILRWNNAARLSQAQGSEYARFQLNEGDIVLSLDRPFINSGTKVARVQRVDLPCLLVQRVGRFRLNPNLLDSDYLFLWLKSPMFTSQVDPGRSSGVPHISSNQVESAEIFLPPLTEQTRLVAEVAKLVTLCDQLEVRINTAQTDSRRLLDSTLDRSIGVLRVSDEKELFAVTPAVQTLAVENVRESYFMPTNPARTEDQLIHCIDDLGGMATPERLLMQAGLGEDVEAFYDLLRAARDSGKILVNLGANKIISRTNNEN